MLIEAGLVPDPYGSRWNRECARVVGIIAEVVVTTRVKRTLHVGLPDPSRVAG